MRIYRQFPTLRLNQLVAKAVLEQPKLKLREAEMYFRVRRQQDSMAKQKDPKRRMTRKDKRTATSRIDSLSDEQLKFLDDIFFRQHKGTLGVRALWEILQQEPQQHEAMIDG